MLRVGQSIERQFVSKNVALFRLWHSHSVMQLSDPRWGTALKIPKLMRREITAGVPEYHITHWNLGLAKACFLLASYVTRLLQETVQVPVWQQGNEPIMTVQWLKRQLVCSHYTKV
jgi:hypothetical protein